MAVQKKKKEKKYKKIFSGSLLNSYSKWVLQVLIKTLFINKQMEGKESLFGKETLPKKKKILKELLNNKVNKTNNESGNKEESEREESWD